ncbi:hypothetical protein ACFPRL_02480 [Pseudoclavibacter helvolus]
MSHRQASPREDPQLLLAELPLAKRIDEAGELAHRDPRVRQRALRRRLPDLLDQRDLRRDRLHMHGVVGGALQRIQHRRHLSQLRPHPHLIGRDRSRHHRKMRIPIQQELSPHHDRRRVVRIKPQNLQRFTIVVEVVHDHSLDRTTDNPRPRRSKPRKTQMRRRVLSAALVGQ